MANTEEDDDSGAGQGAVEAVATVKKKRLYTDEEWVSHMEPQERKFMTDNIKLDDFLEDAKVLCTICNQQVNHKHEVSSMYTGTIKQNLMLLLIQDMLCRHPLLGVVMCKRCKAFFFKGVWKRDEEGYFEHCRWCANGGDLVCCSNEE